MNDQYILKYFLPDKKPSNLPTLQMNKNPINQNVALLATIPCRPASPSVSPSSAAANAVAGSAKLMIKTLMAIAALVGLAASASAQTVAYDASGGAGNPNNGFNNNLNMGHFFYVSGAGIEVSQLGFFDYNGESLTASHAVTLFHNETAIATVTIQSGSATNLISGYAFASLSAPIYLPAGTYTVLAYGMNNADPSGESGGANVFHGSANLAEGGACYDWTDLGSPDYPGGPGDSTYSGGNNQNVSLNWDENTATASFIYTDVTGGSSTWTGLGSDTNWSTAANWDMQPGSVAALTFAGSKGLTNNNDTNITVDSITFDYLAGAFVLDGNAITLSGNLGFNGILSAPISQTINANMTLTTDVTIDTPANGNLGLNGTITSGNSLFTIDAGTLTLGGTNAVESMDVDGGTNIITGNTTITGNTGINGDTGIGYDRFYVGDGDAVAGCFGTLVIQPGAVLDVIGNFNDTFVIGRDNASGGRIIQNGGTFTFNPSNNHVMVLGATSNPNLRSEYDMNGGLLDMVGGQLSVGWAPQTGSIGFVNQIGGVITNVNEICIPFLNAGADNGLGVYTLSGGSVYLLGGGIVNNGPNYVINLGGGTVGAETSWSSSLNMNLTNLNGSVTFDTGAGNTITLSGALSGNGGLTVAGGGTLDFSGANSYTGDTVVNAGSTLELGVTGSDPTTLHLANTATLNLNNLGNYTVLGCYTNGVALPAGTYNANNLSPFITGTGNLVVAATAISRTVACTATAYNSSDTFNTPLNFGHIFNVSGAGIEVFQLGVFDYQNLPLTYSHAVTLFDSSLNAIATVTIPAGTATNLIDGFAYEPLSTPIYLPAGTYTVLSYGFYAGSNNNDPIAEGGAIGFNDSANMTVGNGCYNFTTQGSPIYPGGPGDTGAFGLSWDYQSASASFTYANGIEVNTPPVVNNPVVSGGNLILTGSGGIADAGYTLLTTTNLTAPIIWTTFTTGNLDGSGNFSNSIPISVSTPAQFFQLQMQ
jgi:autotransporter-associated beta strand protein